MPITEAQILHDPVYVEMSRMSKAIETDGRLVDEWSRGKWGDGSDREKVRGFFLR